MDKPANHLDVNQNAKHKGKLRLTRCVCYDICGMHCMLHEMRDDLQFRNAGGNP